MPTPPDALSALLRRADPAAAEAARADDSAAFAAAVHTRLRANESPATFFTLNGWRRELYNLAAVLALIASLAVGGSLGYLRSQRETSEFFAAAYARSIDPVQMHADRSER